LGVPPHCSFVRVSPESSSRIETPLSATEQEHAFGARLLLLAESGSARDVKRV
jgi:hypothetical protein